MQAIKQTNGDDAPWPDPTRYEKHMQQRNERPNFCQRRNSLEDFEFGKKKKKKLMLKQDISY